MRARRSGGRLWGAQFPFERQHLQRNLALLGLGGVFTVTVILLVDTNAAGLIGVAMICAGVVSGLAAASRHRYLRETRIGFAVLRTRDGSFVLGSAAAFVLVATFVLVLLAGPS